MAYDRNTAWSILRRATLPQSELDKMSPALREKTLSEKVYLNHLYQVNVSELQIRFGNPEEEITIKQLSIKLRSKEIIKDWRHFQAIKNQLCGKESLAFEIYPPESQLVDTANQYHLWVFPSDEHFPFIFGAGRLVTEAESNGSKQRPFEEALKPDDLLTRDEMDTKVRETFGL